MTRPADDPHDLLQHTQFVRALCRGLVADPHRAEDLAQDTLVTALQRPPHARDGIRKWLATVARNLACNVARSDTRRRRRENALARSGEVADHTEALEHLELARAIADLALGLADPYRTVVYLRYYEGLGPTAIAARLGVPTKTVKTRLARALAELRSRLDARGPDRGAWRAGGLALAYGTTAGLAPLLAGGLVMKKLLVAAGVLVVGLIGWRMLPGPDVPPAIGSTPIATPDAVAEVPTATPTPAPTERAVVASTATEAPSDGVLLVRAHWAVDGSPAVGIGIAWARIDVPDFRGAPPGTTDAAGLYRVEGLRDGEVLLRTDRGGRVDATVRAGATTEVELAIPDDTWIEGRVVTADGLPATHAEVWSTDSDRLWPRGFVLATAGADGRFQIRGAARDLEICAWARGHLPSVSLTCSDLPTDDHGARTVTLELGEPAGRVAGRVTGPDGSPIAGAHVQVGPRGGFIVDLRSGLRGTAPRPVPIATRPDGTFDYPGDVPAGQQPLDVQVIGGTNWSGTVDVVAGETAFADVVLPLPARVVGRVVLPDGTPVAGARVVQAVEHGGGWYEDVFPPPRAKTGDDGTFVMERLQPGRREFNAVHDHARLGRAHTATLLTAGETTELELVLERGPTIEGRVVDANGRPLADYGVYAEPEPYGNTYPRQDRTDADGKFLLANLGADFWSLRVAAPGQFPLPPRAELNHVRVGRSDVELVVTATTVESVVVTGRIADAAGRVPQDVEVTVWPEHRETGSFADIDRETGTFRCDVMLPGRYLVQIARGGHTLVASGPHALVADRPTDIGLLTIGTTASVAVTVHGVPDLAGVRMWLERMHAGSEVLERDGDVFRASTVGAGTWRLRVVAGSWFVADRVLEVRDADAVQVDVTAVAGVPIDVTLGFPADARWQAVTVTFRNAQGEPLRVDGPWSATRLHDFRSRIPNVVLPAERITIEAVTDDGLRALETLDVEPTRRDAVTLRLR